MKVFNVKELSEYLHCSVSSIRKLVRIQQLPYFRIGNRLFFNKELIDTWVYSQSSNTLISKIERV